MLLGVQSSPLRALLVYGLIAASALTSLAEGPASQPAGNPAATKAQVAQNYGRIPLSFEANQGQADKTVKFLSNGSGYSLFLTDSSAVLALTKQELSSAKPGITAGKVLKPASAHPAGKTDVVRMDLAGANRATQVTGVDQLPGTANYFIGNDPAQWHSGVPTFAKVKYAGVYPGIDLVYYGYGNQRQLEYDFVVAPGASPKPIRLQFAGAKKLDLTADGDLTVSAANGEIAFHKPVVYQVKDGARQPVDGQFAMLAKNTIGFRLGRYDHSKPLVIDPVLTYSTYLGGSLADAAYGIAADSSGNAYVVGTTFSTNFPVTAGAYQSANNEPASFQCAYVTKLNPTGTALVYSTYLGGSGNPGDHAIYGDVGIGIAVDSSGDAYVTGDANSTNFPVTTGAFQTVNNSTKLNTENAFVTKLNATGTALVYSTYLGGNNQDYGSGIAVDSLGDAYVTGSASSSTFPVTAGAFQVDNLSDLTIGWADAFVTKLNSTGTALVYSTYLGGSLYGAKGAAIAVDSLGDAYVTGSAASTDFPITNGAFQTTNFAAAGAGPQTVAYNVFVTKVNPTGTALDYSTFLGGSIDDFGAGIALDAAGDVYVTGVAWSNDFPVAGNPYQSTNPAYANDAPSGFVTEVNPAGTGLVYSTFLGGSGFPPQACGSDCTSSGSGDSASAIAVDGLGDAYVTGTAVSSNFPTTSGAYQTVNNAAGHTSPVGINAFITKLNPGGSSLLYSTYLGGNVQDYGYGIALDGVGGVYVAGLATSTNFPTTTGAYQTANGGYEDAFMAKLAIGPVSEQVATPNVVGDTQAAATTAITGAGLVVGTVTTASSSTVASGNVISESPIAGTSVNSGSAVNLVVSTGPAQVAVPNVVGDTQAAATTAITGAGLVVGTVTTASSSTVASGNVISESPIAGTSVNSGSAVNLVVSTGPAQTSSAATPVFSPAAGSYTSIQSVTITDSTSGAAIYYTTNGTTPTISSTLYNGAIAVSATETVEAIAVASGFSNSAVATADYIIVAAAPGYTLSATPSSLTIKSGSTGSTVITLAPTGGFTGTVNFSCGTLPSKVTCSFAPTSLTAPSSAPLTTTLTVGTAGTTTASLRNNPAGGVLPEIFAALILLPLGFMRRILRTRMTGSPWLVCLLLLAGATLAAAGMLGMAGCGGSSKSFTPAGTYSIPITVTSGGTTVPFTLSITVQ